ncbi:virB8 family protein [Metapseudomonas otitidis]|uniref:virB8 family protein n=1 Tax=Metapseudomonas otitidis TaxID=319939 RepID=UPI0013DFA84A|nr:type IV secretion system protein [Pseudomonas otitidis]
MSDKATSKKTAAQAHIEEAKQWEISKQEKCERSERRAWLVAFGMFVVAAISSTGLALTGPNLRVEPFVVRVDNSTGVVDVMKGLVDGKETYDEALNRYWAQKYVRYREGYSKALRETYYTAVDVMSSEPEKRRYLDWFKPINPESPINVLGETGEASVAFKSVSFMGPKNDVAFVRFIKTVTRPGQKPEITHWASTFNFRYVGFPARESEREVNPLGFKADGYRADSESANYADPLSMPAKQAPAAQPSNVKLYPGQ